jgi:glycine C-acetyltransferase
MDRLSHNCLQEGANASTKNIHKFNHLDQEEMTKMLVNLRKKDPENAILVITEGLFSMDSDSPDLLAYQRICKENNAFLLIDCAHDFGHIGEKGRGFWEVQGLTDLSNVILLGTGSKCLSTNIGFVGCNNPNVIEYLKYYSSAYMFTNAINPVQAATSLANLGILRSENGRQLRLKVLENYHYLKGELKKNGRTVFGNPCAILPVFIGNEVVSRLVSRLMMDMGTFYVILRCSR